MCCSSVYVHMDRLIWFWFITSSKSYQAIHCGNCSGRLLLIRRLNELIVVSYSTAFDHSVPFRSVRFTSVQFSLHGNWIRIDDERTICCQDALNIMGWRWRPATQLSLLYILGCVTFDSNFAHNKWRHRNKFVNTKRIIYCLLSYADTMKSFLYEY